MARSKLCFIHKSYFLGSLCLRWFCRLGTEIIICLHFVCECAKFDYCRLLKLSYHKYLKREYEQEKKARYSNKGWLYATLLSLEDPSSVGAAPNVFPRGPQKITGLYHSKFVIAKSSRSDKGSACVAGAWK